MFKNCLVCKKSFPKPYHESRKNWECRHKFCSKLCHRAWQRTLTSWNKGLKAISDPRVARFVEAGRKARAGKPVWNKGTKGMQVAWNKGVPNPHWRRDKNPNWKGGTTLLSDEIRKSIKYKQWREKVFKRDDYTCVWCGVRGGELQADHIRPQSVFPHLRFRLSNGRTMCVGCHRKTPTFGYNAKKLFKKKT